MISAFWRSPELPSAQGRETWIKSLKRLSLQALRGTKISKSHIKHAQVRSLI